MQGPLYQVCKGVSAAFCAVVVAGVAQASATYHEPESVDFPGFISQEVSPIRSADDVDAAVGVIADPSNGEDERVWFWDEPPTTIDLTVDETVTLDSPVDDILIDAGQTESTTSWDTVIDDPADWLASRDESDGDAQALFSGTASAPDPAAAGFASNVSVIPLPAALTSAGVTIGLIGAAWAIRRLRGSH